MKPFCIAILLSMAVSSTSGFSTSTIRSSLSISTSSASILRAASPIEEGELDTRSFLLSQDEINPLLTFGEPPKEKLVNAHGLWCLLVSLVTGPIWLLAMALMAKKGDNDVNKAEYDNTGKIWSKAWLAATNSYPTISGDVERLKAGNDLGACLFVANHASWLDIPVLCTVLDPVFKFIAKGELAKVPCIGHQLSGGQHILIDREDRRSQLKTFKEGINWLKKGVPLMAFPEGQRSQDGHLMDFKGGLFLMAAKTNVPIVPITLSHTHAIMPSNALFPFQAGAGKLHVHVHDPIHAQGKTEDELSAAVREAFMKTLPLEQQPLETLVFEKPEAETEAKVEERATEEKAAA
mmetsp:Transcript_11204/g.26924  ORF Transcript_11204/g.26924 Transcript_11204/m.26924 type:complete len:350 (-) Transcript_11204:69-1118(-)|eukprot:CAMPEP_0113610564 /NCGR_PEP_ID=MMETSP0017_2-20120614/5094_1 /TAXON_ID=2856 /ORGANISM="Cylindrotheca closterium" /LENGTH=349 /DNA_ID=CAMNT_0000519461 /DNA_START=123 /DNA_END=1172 /DNA_ORIENTATION=+ /assembly_acc=CAM_ASM_000147